MRRVSTSEGRIVRKAPWLFRSGAPVGALLFLSTLLSCAGHVEPRPYDFEAAVPATISDPSTVSDPAWQPWAPGIEYAYLQIEGSEGPVVLHLVRLDLARARLTVRSSGSSSRSTGGTVLLEDPKQLLRQSPALLAVNASPYSAETLRTGAVANISGLSLESGNLVSRPSERLWSFYLTREGQFRLLPPGRTLPGDAVEGSGGFFPLVVDGRPRGRRGPRDARTAIGRHRDGRLYLTVVDGRRWGYSRGATTRELGRWLAEIGVEDALNLDGGGSSILLAREAGARRGRARTVNRPVGALLHGGRRPVANLILVGEVD